jgi:signal transduction histidine kinase
MVTVERLVDPVLNRTGPVDLRALADGIDAVAYEVDLGGWCRFVNRRAIEHFSYSEERWLSQPSFSRTIAVYADRARVRANHSECLRPDRRRNFFFRIVTEDQRAQGSGARHAGTRNRYPLSVIMNASHIIMTELLSGSRSAEACELVTRQSRMMARFVDELTETSRVSAGMSPVYLERVDVRIAMARAAASVGALTQERGHQLALIPPPDPIQIEADPMRLEQILVNLLTNALHYTEPGGTITVEAWDDVEWAAMRVRDTGAGIAPEMLPFIFEPFVRDADESHAGLSGLGLGLSLVKEFAERQGGSVTARSDGLGQGSEFVVRFKRAQAAVAQAAASGPPE